MKFIARVELLLIGLWLGAALFFSLGVAPSAFSVLQNTELAGNVVNRTLTVVNFSGLAIGVLLLIASFLPREYPGAVWAWLRRILLFAVAAGCGAGQFIIGIWISYVRLQIGKPVGELAADDPLKLRFDQLHQASVWTLVIAMSAAFLVFFVMTKKGASAAKQQPAADPVLDFPTDLKI
ncbi:MAG: DUF4149 domain-containing protein [Pyrinomonadaceae bacterium]|nr:DUF4149 domain-containing protein [Pyrinomonadaceae bacterium]